MMQKLRPYLGWAAVALLLLFILFNLHAVEIAFLPGVSVRGPAAFVVIFSAALGAGSYWALGLLKKNKPKA